MNAPKPPPVTGRCWPIDAPFQTVIDSATDKPLVRNGFTYEARPGDFFFRDKDGKETRDPAKAVRFGFYCPKELTDGKASYCGEIHIAKGVKPPGNSTWAWDGNFETPTLHPSINCLQCWHGFVKKGIFSVA